MAGRKSAAEADSLFHALISTAVDGIMVIDERGLVNVYNNACEKLFGYPESEVIGRNVSMLMPSPYHEEHDKYLARYNKTREARIIGIGREVVGRRKDGTTFPMYLSVGEGKVDRACIFVGIVSDLTERHERMQRIQELQNELLHVARLTDMGQLSSAMAHELNQPLTAILNYASAAKDLATDDQMQKIMQRIAEQTTRAGNIIRRLRAFVEKREPNHTVEDIRKTIEDAIELGQIGLAEASARLHIDMQWNMPPVMIDRIQIQQVLVNLIRNAVEAMDGCALRDLFVQVKRDENDFIAVSVRDTGKGMSKETEERLFQPFMTTKEKGMGMGLTICRAIVEAHGGKLWVARNKEAGMTFHFTLPVAKEG